MLSLTKIKDAVLADVGEPYTKASILSYISLTDEDLSDTDFAAIADVTDDDGNGGNYGIIHIDGKVLVAGATGHSNAGELLKDELVSLRAYGEDFVC